jgi:hypothetical protein
VTNCISYGTAVAAGGGGNFNIFTVANNKTILS